MGGEGKGGSVSKQVAKSTEGGRREVSEWVGLPECSLWGFGESLMRRMMTLVW